MKLVNINKAENETVKAIKAQMEKEKELRCRATIVANGTKGVAWCLESYDEMPCIRFESRLYSKFGDPLPDNWVWRTAMSKKTAALWIFMILTSIWLITMVTPGEW